MTEPTPSEPATSRTSRAPLVALVLALAIPGSTAALWIAPRPAPPAEMPPLVVPQARAEATLARVSGLARGAPEEDASDTRRRELYLAHGLAEVSPNAPPGQARERDAELHTLGEALAAAGQLEAVRARDVTRVMDLLGRGGDDAERLAEAGALPRALEQYGAVIEGRRIAPRLVVLALAWARWNGVHNRPLTEGMDDTMLLAYHGWLVYYGPTGGTELRDGALVEYVQAGGQRGLETEAFLRLSRNDTTGAQLAFEAAYEATGNVRLRNHALALGLATLTDDGSVGDGG